MKQPLQTRRVKEALARVRDCVLAAFAHKTADASAVRSHDRAIQRLARLTAGSAADDLTSIPHFEEQWNERVGVSPIDWFDLGMKNYLGARLFGNWVAYQGQGLRSIVEWLRTCAALVRHFVLQRLIGSGLALDHSVFTESVRSADLLLLHVLDSGLFARDIASLERSGQP